LSSSAKEPCMFVHICLFYRETHPDYYLSREVEFVTGFRKRLEYPLLPVFRTM